MLLAIWRSHPRTRIAEIANHSGFGNAVEVGEELVILLVRDRIVFMAVATRAPDGQAHKHCRSRVYAIHDVFDVIFRRNNAAFGIRAMIAIESRSDALFNRRRWATNRPPIAQS